MTVPPCRQCGADTAVVPLREPSVPGATVMVICVGCRERTVVCTCPPRPTTLEA